MLPAELPAHWRERAAILRKYGATAQAETVEALAAEAEAAVSAYEAEELDFAEAAAESGYSTSQLRRLFPGRTVIPRRCLPRKPTPIATPRLHSVSSPVQIAREILNAG